MTQPDPIAPSEIASLRLDLAAPVAVIDIDEVLGLFLRGFEGFVRGHGLEMRIDRFALLQNIYRPGESEHLDLRIGRDLLNRFFEEQIESIEVVPGAADALANLSLRAGVVILTNAPEPSRAPRTRWLVRHGFDYPQVLNTGPKGPMVAALAGQTTGRTVFVDDMLPNLDSAAERSPSTRRFQMVADPRLRPFAPTSPDRHTRIDDWTALGEAIAAAISE